MSARRDSVGLTAASVINGLAAYALVVVASRSLDTPDFAAFSVAWSIWALCVALLVFPVQHWIIWRTAVDRGPAGVRKAIPRVVGLIVVVLAALWLAGRSDRLFPSGESWSLLLVLIGGTSAALGVGRGALAAVDRYGDVAWVLGLENVLRLIALMVVLQITLDPAPAVLTLAVGVLALIPFIRQLRLDRVGHAGEVRVMAELGALAGATALAQVLVQFPPAYAEWLGEPPEVVSALFATFSLGRAPLLVILAVSTRLTDPITRFFSRQGSAVRPLLGRAMLAVAGGVVVTAVVGYAIGPEVVALFFGPDRVLDRSETSLIAAGLALAAAGVFATLGLMAKGSNRLAAGYWLMGLVISMAIAARGGGIPLSFLVAEMVAVSLCCGTLWIISTRPQVSSEPSR